ncbi:MAG: transcriptional regulator [Gammaproteobacteria bacterium]|jgi:predicted ArsR family transcriptional regulator|nr:transcriptional regulator [Gammaproteobacteria bacterium]
MKLATSQKIILDQLKRYGPQSVKVLAKRLNMTTMGIRQHLQDLQHNELVTTTTEARQTRGRPLHLWRLTAEGHDQFPARHQELNLELLSAIREELGESALIKLVATQSDRTAEHYQKLLSGIDDFEHRLTALADIRTKDGFMAEVRLLPDQSWLLIENHCPVCSAAKQCRHYCDYELILFKRLLGDTVKIYRTEYLLEGNRRCAYKISKPT